LSALAYLVATLGCAAADDAPTSTQSTASTAKEPPRDPSATRDQTPTPGHYAAADLTHSSRCQHRFAHRAADRIAARSLGAWLWLGIAVLTAIVEVSVSILGLV
jgi:hypothetical protein